MARSQQVIGIVPGPPDVPVFGVERELLSAQEAHGYRGDHMRALKLRSVLSVITTLVLATAAPADGFGDAMEAPQPWAWRTTVYSWLTWLDGDVTVRSREFEVNATAGDVIDALDFAFMGTIEGRRGPWSLWADIVYANLGSSNDVVISRPGQSLGVALSADLRMATIEAAAAYELAPAVYAHLDVYVGARYWSQRTDVALDATALANIDGIELSGSRAIARSGRVDWVDPIVGVRFRRDLPFGGEAFMRADVGGFGAGSKFSWQAIAAVNWRVCEHAAIVWDAYLGYRALSVDFEEGDGPTRYEYDVTEHGPMLGLTGRF